MWQLLSRVMDEIGKLFEGLDELRNGTSNLPAKAFARQSYLDAIERRIGKVPNEPHISGLPHGAFADLGGMPVYRSEILPKGVLCLFLDKDNKPVGQVVDDTYVP